jgi:hypothetical protein
MEKQQIIERLVNMYFLIQKDEKHFKDDEISLVALRNQRFGVRMSAGALGLWDEVCEKIEQERLTQNKS